MVERGLLDYLEATALYQKIRARMNRGLVAFFRRHVFADKHGLRIAEVACGSGLAAHLIAQQSEVALSLAADLNQEDHRQAAIPNFQAVFVLMDLFRPAALPASMDLVWNSSSIEELENPIEAVTQMAWLVKPGGLVFIGVPNRFGLAGLLGIMLNERGRAWLGRSYSRGELRALLEKAGLQVAYETSYLFGVFIGALARK